MLGIIHVNNIHKENKEGIWFIILTICLGFAPLQRLRSYQVGNLELIENTIIVNEQ